VVVGNLSGIPGGFPGLCAEYRQGGSKKGGADSAGSVGGKKKTAVKANKAAPSPAADEDQIIGNADEFFVNPLGK
jgi:hypothetical protein